MATTFSDASIYSFATVWCNNNHFLCNFLNTSVIEALRYKLKGSIHNEATGFFKWSNPSSHTMALGSFQPLWEMKLNGSKRVTSMLRIITSLPSMWAIYLEYVEYMVYVPQLFGPPQLFTGITLSFYLSSVWGLLMYKLCSICQQIKVMWQ
jgi:hypothetical protein